MADLGTELSDFMTNVQPFIEGAKSIDPKMLTGVQTLAETILILTAANLLEGIASFITGSSSIEEFGSQLGGLGTNLRTFAENLGTFGTEQVSTISCACSAIKSLAEAADTLPNSGGWLGKIVGENDIGTFGAQLHDLGTHLASFVKNLGTFTEEQVTTVGCAADAIVSLAEAASELPNDGGWLGKIIGENSIGAFGDQLPKLGTDLTNFVTNLGTFSEEQVTTVKCAGDAILALANAAKELPNDGGLWGKIVG
jgi:hypothetical protein